MSDLPVEVIRSKRRKRTAQADIVDGRVLVRVPYGLPADEEARLVTNLTRRVTRKLTSAPLDLADRARELAGRYGLPLPASIEWSDRQTRRWGSCSRREEKIRVSSRLASMPLWVLDWVLIHELAHLVVASHGPRFQALVGRYELAERAEGYLIAKSEGPSATSDELESKPEDSPIDASRSLNGRGSTG